MAEPSPAPRGLYSFLFCFVSLRMKLRAQWHQYLFLLADSRFFFFNWKRSILGNSGSPLGWGGYFLLNIYLLIWLHRMLVVAHVFFSNCGTWIQFLLSMCDSINSSPKGIKPVSPPLEGRSSTTGAAKEVPGGLFLL